MHEHKRGYFGGEFWRTGDPHGHGQPGTVEQVSVTTATATNFAVPGTNGCAAGTTGVGSLITVRLHRSADSAAGDAHLLGAIVTSKRSQ